MASLRLRIFAVSALAFGLAAPLFAQTVDDAAIRAMVKAQESAFNAHDAAAYGQLLEMDADMVTSLGWRVKGKDAYVSKLGEAFAGPLGKAHLHAGEVSVRALGPDLALAFVTWTDTAARKESEAIESQIVRRQPDGRWLIAAAQETDVKPERATAAKGSEDAPTVPQPARKCMLGRPNGDCLLFK